MKRTLLALPLGLLLAAGQAHAVAYNLVEGSFADLGGAPLALTGTLDALPPAPEFAVIPDFSFDGEGIPFEANVPISYMGLEPVAYLQLADGISFVGGAIDFFTLRAGAELVEEGVDEVVFAFLDFRADSGLTSDFLPSGLPGFFDVQGELVWVFHRFEVLLGPCVPPEPGQFCFPSGPGLFHIDTETELAGSFRIRALRVPEPAALLLGAAALAALSTRPRRR